jgi:hypothetical protein
MDYLQKDKKYGIIQITCFQPQQLAKTTSYRLFGYGPIVYRLGHSFD